MRRSIANGWVGSVLTVLLVACGGGGSDSAQLSFSPNSAPPPSGTTGVAYPTFTFVAPTGGLGPFTWAESGTLPPGMSLSLNGRLSGTPITAGTFSFTLTVTDSSSPNQVAKESVTLLIKDSPLVINATPLPPGGTQVPYVAFVFTASGGSAPFTWRVTAGALPGGLSLNANGTLSGTPVNAGATHFIVTAQDSSATPQTNSRVFFISIYPPPTISAFPPPPGATVNQPYRYSFAATGHDVTLSATGVLPPGLAPVTPSGVLAGRPTVTGTFPIVVTAVDDVRQSVTQDFSIDVFPHGFGPTGSMQVLRDFGGHTATLLSTGQVLVAGGGDSLQPGSDATAEIFDPKTRSFTLTGNMTTGRSGHTATLLCDLTAASCSNPKVLIVGGGYVDTSELFDPSTGTFSPTGSLGCLTGHTATLLGNGKVLITGGNISSEAYLYDPSTGMVTFTGSMATPRQGHTATLLASGKVLIAGGQDNAGFVASAELYDPVSGMFTVTGTMQATRSNHSATRLPDGRVLIVGGDGTGTATAELYDPANGRFTATGSTAVPRTQHAAALLPDGTVLVAGGIDWSVNVVVADAELYDRQTGTFSETGGLQNARSSLAMTALGRSGRVLVTGGFGTPSASAGAELYQ